MITGETHRHWQHGQHGQRIYFAVAVALVVVVVALIIMPDFVSIISEQWHFCEKFRGKLVLRNLSIYTHTHIYDNFNNSRFKRQKARKKYKSSRDNEDDRKGATKNKRKH